MLIYDGSLGGFSTGIQEGRIYGGYVFICGGSTVMV